MALRNLFSTPPFKSPIVSQGGTVTLPWLTFLNALAELGRVRVLDAPLDPVSIPAGNSLTATVTIAGVTAGDFPSASFVPANAAVMLAAQVTADNTVAVTFLNLSGGAIDLPAGTLRVRVEAQ